MIDDSANLNGGKEMSGLRRYGTAGPVSRDQLLIIGTNGDKGKVYFPNSADHEQDWQPPG